MNTEQKLIKQLTPIKFEGSPEFIIPNHSGILSNTEAKASLQRTPTAYRGTDFAGANPTKTLTHSRALPNNVDLVINGRTMHRTYEYTISGSVITMVGVVIDDADYIEVRD